MIEKIQNHIENVLKLAFKRVQYAFDHNKENEPMPLANQNEPIS